MPAQDSGRPADAGSRAKKTVKKATPVKKAAGVKKTAAAKAMPAKKTTANEAAPAKKTAAAKKTSAAKMAPTAKKTTAKRATANKAAPAAARKTPPVRRSSVAKAVEGSASPKAAATAPVVPPGTPPPADSAAPDDTARPPQRNGAFPTDPQGIDKPWLGSYPPLVPESYPYPDVGLTRLLDDAAKDFPDSIAIDFAGKSLTYRRLADHVDRFAHALRTLGVGKGQRVGIALPNCPQHVIAFFAVLRVGATVVEIDPGLDERGLAARINDAGCRVLVVLDPVYARVERLKGKVPTVEHVVGTALADYMTPAAGLLFNFRHRRDTSMVRKIPAGEGVLRFAELVRQHQPAGTQERLTPAEDIALLTYPRTDPRGDVRAVALTHRNLLANVFQVRLWVPDVQAGRETILCVVPFWESFGITTCLSLGALSAAKMSLVPTFDAAEVLSLIDKGGPTLFPTNAAIVEQLVGAPNLRKFDLTAIRASLCNTASLPDELITAFEEATGGRLRLTLSLPEAAAVTHANPVYGKAKTDRVGLPLSDTTCALLDLDDPSQLAADGSPGQLAVHGPQVMKGYWNRPDATAAALRDGWLLTGLVADVDEDGYYRVTGRTDVPAPSAGTAAIA